MINAFFATVRSVSKPFNAGQHVEVKLDIEQPSPANVAGEIVLRIFVLNAPDYPVGRVVSIRINGAD